MKKILSLTISLILITINFNSTDSLVEKYGLKIGSPQIGSFNEITFGPDGLLFIADTQSAKIYAVDTKDREPSLPNPEFKLANLELEIADRLGLEKEDVMVHDMAVNPISRNIYLSISLKRKEWVSAWKSPNGLAYSNMLLKVNANTKGISEVKLQDIGFSEYEIEHAIPRDSVGKRRSTVVDMKFKDGQLMVAGMSGQSFDSKFKIIPFPFKDESQTTSLEIFHYIHNYFETWAPINVFDTYKRDGETRLLGVYYCTPLVTFNLDEFEDGGKVRGETISEMWPGSNRPLDMIIYDYDNIKYALVSLSSRGLVQFKIDDINSFQGNLVQKRKEMSAVDKFTNDVGVEFKVYPGAVQQLDDFSQDHFLVLQRMENGSLDLRLRMKKSLSVFGD